MDKTAGSQPGLEEAYRIVIAGLPNLAQQLSARYTNLIQLFGIASLIVGVATSLSTSLFGTRLYWPNLFFYLAILAFVSVIIWTYSGLRARTLYLGVDPTVLREDYWGFEPPEFRQNLYSYAEQAYQRMKRLHDDMIVSLRGALVSMLFEVNFLLAWAFLRSLYPTS